MLVLLCMHFSINKFGLEIVCCIFVKFEKFGGMKAKSNYAGCWSFRKK